MNDQKKIWLVEDDLIAVTIMRHIIKKHPYFQLIREFDGAEFVIETLKEGRQELPDLIVLDLNMPMMNGWDLLEFLQKEYTSENIPVAIFTSSIDSRDASKSSHYPNVIGHFIKPITHPLLENIKDCLKAHYSKSR